jgi:hypothetical protein
MKMKKLLISMAIMSVMCVVSGCKQSAQKTSDTATSTTKEMKIENINSDANTFDFVDVSSGQKLSYKKLMVNNREVVETQSMQGILSSVIFVFEKFSTENIGYTTHAVLKYNLENGELNILSDTPVEKPVEKSNSEIETIQFKGGTCRLIEFKREAEKLNIVFKYTLEDNTHLDVIDVLGRGNLVASDGTIYKLPERFSNEENSLVKLIFIVPQDVDIKSLKYVLNKQELHLLPPRFR